MPASTARQRYGVPEKIADGRWRIRIGYQHGKRGNRVPRSFYWPADGVPACPPHVVADAVAKQDEWRRIVGEWPAISHKLKIIRPGIDWTMPVWFDTELIVQFDAAADADTRNAIDAWWDDEQRREHADANQAVRWIALNGLTAIIKRLRYPVVLPDDPSGHYRRTMGPRLESGRATALAELQPAIVRSMVEPISVRAAVDRFLSDYAQRVDQRTSRRVEQRTCDALAENLRGAFGQSVNADKPPIRQTPIAFDAPLSSVNKPLIESFAAY